MKVAGRKRKLHDVVKEYIINGNDRDSAEYICNQIIANNPEYLEWYSYSNIIQEVSIQLEDHKFEEAYIGY